jgi:hypothetical protein
VIKTKSKKDRSAAFQTFALEEFISVLLELIRVKKGFVKVCVRGFGYCVRESCCKNLCFRQAENCNSLFWLGTCIVRRESVRQ